MDFTDFECDTCHEVLRNNNVSDTRSNNALSVVMKVHDQKHDYHNTWIPKIHSETACDNCKGNKTIWRYHEVRPTNNGCEWATEIKCPKCGGTGIFERDTEFVYP